MALRLCAPWCVCVPNVQEARPGKFLTGDKLTHGDLAVFCQMSTLQSGWLDGERQRAGFCMGASADTSKHAPACFLAVTCEGSGSF